MLNHAVGLLIHPRQQWQALRQLSECTLKRNAPYAIVLALMPALAWYVGTTEFGWRIGAGEATYMTEQSALALMGGFYFSLLVAVAAIGYFIHWMSNTYGVKTDPLKGYVIAGFIATPIFIAGMAGIYPQLWLNIILVLAAIGYAVYLLYTGLPIMFDLPEERGFLFASSVVGVAMVIGVSMMAAMVIYWDLVAHPEFI
ncbi:YIP1 family protein [Simiduia sp. 21SJ11W-1]|uniref:Yip1 family protein n=1 Tax=Simiduia sp. 21SJ11W-1 TaxID=2909669 RepID=UPI00209D026B|nr:Yip1 family protein [Simiduia sp. 21SJ11W-1]UTA47226.1 YIP1 family protein [Simiduia sp. 21SJ11W-1]